MTHGVIDVVAFQEALLIEAVLGIALLTMLWVGFRRWLQQKERMGRFAADQATERSVQYRAEIERLEARLKSIEQMLTKGTVQTPAHIKISNDPAPTDS